MATAISLSVEGGFFPAPSLVNKDAGQKGMAICSIMGSTGKEYTITSTDKAAMGIASIDGVVVLGSETALALTGTTPAIQVVGEKIKMAAHPTWNKKITIGVFGKPVEPKQ